MEFVDGREPRTRMAGSVLMAALGGLAGAGMGAASQSLYQLGGDLLGGDETPGYTSDELASIALAAGLSGTTGLVGGALMGGVADAMAEERYTPPGHRTAERAGSYWDRSEQAIPVEVLHRRRG
jgi:hypothetical protein